MNTNINFKKIAPVYLILGIALAVLLPPLTSNAASCTFTNDLQIGSLGEDVRCLQQYLNANGFVITTSGGGSLGNETTEYKTLTQAAVMKWQKANNISPATGSFGPKSRQAYAALIKGSPLPITSQVESTSNAVLLAQIVSLKAGVAQALTGNSSGSSLGPKAVRSQMNDAMSMIEDAQDKVDDIKDDRVAKKAENSLRDARANFFAAVRAYVDGDYSDAEKYLTDTEDSVDKTLGVAGDTSEDTEDDLDAARDELKDARDEVEVALDDGDKVGDAEDLLDEAKESLDDAEDALDNDDKEEAKDLISEALDLIKDARKEL